MEARLSPWVGTLDWGASCGPGLGGTHVVLIAAAGPDGAALRRKCFLPLRPGLHSYLALLPGRAANSSAKGREHTHASAGHPGALSHILLPFSGFLCVLFATFKDRGGTLYPYKHRLCLSRAWGWNVPPLPA